jgi:serine/tyrosine/threonine adenylyltransferase
MQATCSSLPGFEHSFHALGEGFHSLREPARVQAPELIMLNQGLADQIGMDPDWLAGPDGLAMLSGNRMPATARPLAMVYAGHQFGNWVPRLGDGRALLLGELIGHDGIRRDVQLKGSGPTPYSRGGDGRSSIGPVVREYLGSEAMAALGIPTTRSLAAVSTGEEVFREKPEPGGILCRVATSHIRIGTFEYFARRGDDRRLARLADYVIQRHFPGLSDQQQRHLHLLEKVVERTANLVAQWMLVGFIHGVMNTDNLSIVGETIDYGPFGYIDHFDPSTAYSYIDRRGRYAWNRQPMIAQWNLSRLAECLLVLIDDDESTAVPQVSEALDVFKSCFESRFHAGLNAKLGLVDMRPGDTELAMDLLVRMHAQQADMTLTFRGLSRLDSRDSDGDQPVRELFDEPEAFDAWAVNWRQRLGTERRPDADRRKAMEAVNPAFILRNHLAQHAVDAAIENLDFEPMRRLNRVLARPFHDQPEQVDLAQPPRPDERVLHTFCGT